MQARPRDDEDDDTPRKRNRERDDDDDDRPRKKRKKSKKPKGMSRGQKQLLIFGGIGAVVLLLALVGGVFAVLAMFPKPDKTMAGVGWYEAHEEVNHTVTAYFPGQKPEYEKHGMKMPAGLAKLGNSTSEELSWNVKTWESKHAGRQYTVLLWTFPSKGSEPGMMESTVLGQRMPAEAGVQKTEEQITFSGRQARRVTVRGKEKSTVYVMTATGDNQMCIVSVYGPGQFDQTDPLVTAFFDNVTVK